MLNATVNHRASKYFTKWKYFVEIFLRDLYLDDSTSGFDTVFASYNFYLKAKSMMHDAGFDLRKWASNSSELMKKIESKSMKHMILHPLIKTQREITWDIKSDKIIFDFSNLVAEAFKRINTKRSIYNCMFLSCNVRVSE